MQKNFTSAKIAVGERLGGRQRDERALRDEANEGYDAEVAHYNGELDHSLTGGERRRLVKGDALPSFKGNGRWQPDY